MYSNMKKAISTAMALLVVFALSAKHIEIKGSIKDKATGERLPYVALQVSGTYVGTQSNADGHYVLKVADNRLSDTVVFSLMGYEKLHIAISDLRKQRHLKLMPHALDLKEVTVKDFASPQSLLDEVLRRIPQNYHSTPTVSTFFFRRWSMANDSLYLFYESLTDVYRAGYGNFNKRLIYIGFSGKSNLKSNYKDILKHRLPMFDTTYLLSVVGSPSTMRSMMTYYDHAAILDVVEFPNASYVFAKRKRKDYNYKLEEFTDAEGKEFYLITMMSKSDKSYTFSLVIDKADLAVCKITYQYSGEYTNSDNFMQKIVSPFKSGVVHYDTREYVYKKIAGKYTLFSYRSGESSDNVCHMEYGYQNAMEHQSYKHSYVYQLVDFRKNDTDTLPDNVIKAVKPQLYSTLMSNGRYDESFFENYNFVPLEDECHKKLKGNITENGK